MRIAAMYDVVQIGYGPVSQALALMLGRQKRKVLVCERWNERYPLPRAVCIDHELYRVLWANGMGSVLPEITERGPLYQWFNADWRQLLEIDWSADSISGGPEVNFVHQPTVEQALDVAVAGQATVDTLLGWEAVSIRQSDNFAEIDLREVESGERKTVTARYVVGCDGANSLTRETIGGQQEDRGFEADWLVIDVLLKPGVTIERLGIPAAGQYCNPVRPTTIVPAGLREGRTFRRWEFMRLPGESVSSLESEDKVWSLLAPWAGPDDIELVRHKVYNFRSLLAARWRDGRLLVAGDAAHVMPPFMGQGMCSGLRDAWNLAWKLDLVLDGKAEDRLLDTYQPERMPHVSQIIDMSIYLGKMICIPDEVAAAVRDEAFFTGKVEPMPPFPALTDGLIFRGKDGVPTEGAGLLSPHVDLLVSGVVKRLDDLTAGHFLVVSTGFVAERALTNGTREALDRIDAQFVSLVSDSIRDLDGRLDDFLAAQGWAAMIVRPDFYVYGGSASEAGLEHLANAFIRDLVASGVRMTTKNILEAEAT